MRVTLSDICTAAMLPAGKGTPRGAGGAIGAMAGGARNHPPPLEFFILSTCSFRKPRLYS